MHCHNHNHQQHLANGSPYLWRKPKTPRNLFGVWRLLGKCCLIFLFSFFRFIRWSKCQPAIVLSANGMRCSPRLLHRNFLMRILSAVSTYTHSRFGIGGRDGLGPPSQPLQAMVAVQQCNAAFYALTKRTPAVVQRYNYRWCALPLPYSIACSAHRHIGNITTVSYLKVILNRGIGKPVARPKHKIKTKKS